jgi:RNA-directed DNA polymerase
VQSFKDKIKKALKKHRGIPAYAIIRILNPIIRGWSNYHKKVCSKKTFNYLGHFLWWQLWRWCKREYGNRPKKWIFEKHFRKNAFSDEMMTKKGKAIIKLYDIAKVPIKYHTKIRAVATPYLSEFDKYFIARDKRKQKEASECKQKTLVLMNKRTCNSRVSRNRGSLINA